MPVFDYKCDACGERFEKLCSSPDKEQVVCPKCGGKKATKLFTVFSMHSSSCGRRPERQVRFG